MIEALFENKPIIKPIIATSDSSACSSNSNVIWDKALCVVIRVHGERVHELDKILKLENLKKIQMWNIYMYKWIFSTAYTTYSYMSSMQGRQPSTMMSWRPPSTHTCQGMHLNNASWVLRLAKYRNVTIAPKYSHWLSTILVVQKLSNHTINQVQISDQIITRSALQEQSHGLVSTKFKDSAIAMA